MLPTQSSATRSFIDSNRRGTSETSRPSCSQRSRQRRAGSGRAREVKAKMTCCGAVVRGDLGELGGRAEHRQRPVRRAGGRCRSRSRWTGGSLVEEADRRAGRTRAGRSGAGRSRADHAGADDQRRLAGQALDARLRGAPARARSAPPASSRTVSTQIQPITGPTLDAAEDDHVPGQHRHRRDRDRAEHRRQGAAARSARGAGRPRARAASPGQRPAARTATGTPRRITPGVSVIAIAISTATSAASASREHEQGRPALPFEGVVPRRAAGAAPDEVIGGGAEACGSI